MGKGIVNAFKWKLFERVSTQLVQFAIQVIIARLLGPDYYGQLAILLVFVILANTFIQSGFNTALVQSKKISDEDYDSVFWISAIISVFLYVVLFLTAPIICGFNNIDSLVDPFRVLALVLFPGSIYSIQQAKINREFKYRTLFISSLISGLISGIIGVILAYLGAGLWALVIQNLLNTCVGVIILWFSVNWRPHFKYSFSRVKNLFSFGWKLMIASLLDTLSTELQSLIIGKKYSTEALGFFDRGKQFPQFLISSVNGSIQTVMLSALSREQDEKSKIKAMLKETNRLSAFIVFPICAGLAGVATNVISLLLGDEWIGCIPYVQIFCLCFAMYPIYTSNLQTINALGRSDIFLKLEIIKKIYGIGLIILAVVIFDSPSAIAWASVIAIIPSFIVNVMPNRKLIDYGVIEQALDIVPFMVVSAVMFVGVFYVGEVMNLPIILELIIQIILGFIFYVSFSFFMKIKEFEMIIKFFKKK